MPVSEGDGHPEDAGRLWRAHRAGQGRAARSRGRSISVDPVSGGLQLGFVTSASTIERSRDSSKDGISALCRYRSRLKNVRHRPRTWYDASDHQLKECKWSRNRSLTSIMKGLLGSCIGRCAVSGRWPTWRPSPRPCAKRSPCSDHRLTLMTRYATLGYFRFNPPTSALLSDKSTT